MIRIGLIVYGPELDDAPVRREIRRLEQTLHADARDPVLEIVYVVPGSRGRAAFDGFEIRRGSAPPLINVFVAVPAEVATSAEPGSGLVALARQAVAVADTWWAGNQDRPLRVELDALLDRADVALRQRWAPSSPERGADDFR